MPDISIPAVLRSRWLHYAVLAIALALTFVWGKAGWRSADSWQLAHKAQKAAYVAAAQAATAKAIAARLRTETQYAELARKADHAEIPDLRAAADRFAATRRVRAEATCGASSGPAATAPAGPAPDRDRAGADAVVLTRPEYDDLVSNSIRLERVRQWGETLIAAELAVPEVEFGK